MARLKAGGLRTKATLPNTTIINTRYYPHTHPKISQKFYTYYIGFFYKNLLLYIEAFMTLDKFLKLSRLMDSLPQRERLNFHLTRYKYLYENSSHRHNCVYAKKTFLLFNRENERDAILKWLDTLVANDTIKEIREGLLYE